LCKVAQKFKAPKSCSKSPKSLKRPKVVQSRPMFKTPKSRANSPKV
jgi:hypothetical protein